NIVSILVSLAFSQTFFFMSFHIHLNLNSFPTRRSSDLTCVSSARTAAVVRRATGRAPPVRLSRAGSAEHRQADTGACRPEIDERSEEHTSELQSRREIVCRLLLEKKKKKKKKKQKKTKT